MTADESGSQSVVRNMFGKSRKTAPVKKDRNHDKEESSTTEVSSDFFF
jgi:hypothetical protein